MNINVLRFDSIESTNTEAMDQARRGADEGLCVVARQQTAGRGRHGRTWVSDPDAGLYFSIVLRPDLTADQLPLITLMAGIVVSDALHELGLQPDIKWVNDILIGEKKIAGILSESVETPTGLAVIVGIGINLTSQNFPDEIAETATSVRDEHSHGSAITAADVEDKLIKHLEYWHSVISGTVTDGKETLEKIPQDWEIRSSYASGKSVRVTLPNETIYGITDGLEPNGALRVRSADGSINVIHAGDVERLRATG